MKQQYNNYCSLSNLVLFMSGSPENDLIVKSLCPVVKQLFKVWRGRLSHSRGLIWRPLI